jgi:hypothetical protein
MREPVGLLRRALPFLSIAVIAAVAYDGWIFYSRWQSKREGERARQEDEIRRARETINMIGGTGFRIISFYASPQVVRPGGQAKLCFGVYGAKHVRIDPGVGDVKPAINDCLQVAPQKNTEYTLVADDGAGHTVKQSIELKVAP